MILPMTAMKRPAQMRISISLIIFDTRGSRQKITQLMKAPIPTNIPFHFSVSLRVNANWSIVSGVLIFVNKLNWRNFNYKNQQKIYPRDSKMTRLNATIKFVKISAHITIWSILTVFQVSLAVSFPWISICSRIAMLWSSKMCGKNKTMFIAPNMIFTKPTHTHEKNHIFSKKNFIYFTCNLIFTWTCVHAEVESTWQNVAFANCSEQSLQKRPNNESSHLCKRCHRESVRSFINFCCRRNVWATDSDIRRRNSNKKSNN